MRKEKSWAQRDYESAYVWMRRGVTCEWLQANDQLSQYAIKAADYSYQAYGYIQSGWSSTERCKRFYAIKWRIYTQQKEIPF